MLSMYRYMWSTDQTPEACARLCRWNGSHSATRTTVDHTDIRLKIYLDHQVGIDNLICPTCECCWTANGVFAT